MKRVQDIDSIEKMVYLLPELVDSPLSLNALREDLQVSHQSVSRWMNMLENLYMVSRIYPFGAPRIRAVNKEAKHYHLDWTLLDDGGLRFENLVACHLLKWCHFVQDTEAFHMELRYFRDVDKHEVDFVLLKDGQPNHFIEYKKAGREINPALRYLKRRFPAVQATQISLDKDLDLITKYDIRLRSAYKFLADF